MHDVTRGTGGPGRSDLRGLVILVDSTAVRHAPLCSLNGVKLLPKSYFVPEVEHVLSWLRFVAYMAFPTGQGAVAGYHADKMSFTRCASYNAELSGCLFSCLCILVREAPSFLQPNLVGRVRLPP